MSDHLVTEALRFPIGKFTKPEDITADHIKEWVEDIALFPSRLIRLTAKLSESDIEKTYREGSWTIRQVVHHCADSHMNSLVRFKWTLTEDTPEIKAYYEDRWAVLADSKMPLSISLTFLEALHQKWVYLLKSLDANDLKKSFIHPEHGKQFTLAENIGVYAWHCNHHLAHIRLALGLQADNRDA